MRGLQTHVTDHLSHDRIIPARAGFTLSSTRRLPVRADHPRACGVYQVEGRLVHSPSGSSPRVRGLPAPWFPAGPCRGIIPARAGFTLPRDWRHAARTDHPRACGVYHKARRNPPRNPGSSPRVRGLLVNENWWIGRERIIPARAGFTFGVSEVGSAALGSSPRVRGLPATIMSGRPIAGIIPARAGFTAHPYANPYAEGDHPRACGVYY